MINVGGEAFESGKEGRKDGLTVRQESILFFPNTLRWGNITTEFRKKACLVHRQGVLRRSAAMLNTKQERGQSPCLLGQDKNLQTSKELQERGKKYNGQ